MMVAELLLGLLAVAGVDEAVAKVDGVAITAGAVAERVETYRSRGREMSPDEAVSGLVDEAILAAEARRLGAHEDPAVAERLRGERRRVAADVFVEEEVAKSVTVPDDALRTMFHSTSDFARLQLLMYETREAADAARARIAKGSSPATEGASALSAKVTPKDADAPYHMRAQLEPELADAVFKASPGTVVGPVPLKLGFAVAKVVEIVVGTDAELAAKRPQLEQHARKKYAAQARAHLVQQLRAKSGVKVDEAFLRGLKGLEASPAELDHVVATINGRPLRYRDVHRSIQSIVGGSGHLAGPAVRVQIAWSEVDARLVQDLAAERGYDRRPSVVAQAAAAERYVLAIEVVERIRKAVPPPTQAEVAAFYKQNAARFGKPLEQVQAEATAAAGAQKKDAVLLDRLQDLRKKATVVVDKAALSRALARAT